MKKLTNIQEYIATGILEQYALGLTSIDQNKEIIYYLSQHSELREELTKIESSLETYASTYAQVIPSDLKSRILDKISTEANKNDNSGNKNSLKNSILFYVAIAALTACLIYFWNINNKSKEQIQEKTNELNAIQQKIIQDSLSLLDCSNQLEFLRNKNFNRIILKGTPKSPQSFAMIYYDKSSRKTMLDPVDLPAAPVDKQYQLWGIVDGKPVDLGVFDMDTTSRLKEIKFIDNVQAFAVTLEPKGGLPSPTMSNMYVIGNN